MSVVTLDGSPLTIAEVAAVARGEATVALDAATRQRLAHTRTQL
jgi:histidine ammonia-lyase